MATFGVEGIRYFGNARAAGVSTAGDLTYTFNRCNDLDRELRAAGHTRSFYWANTDCRETDIRDFDRGGDDRHWVDDVDLSFLDRNPWQSQRRWPGENALQHRPRQLENVFGAMAAGGRLDREAGSHSDSPAAGGPGSRVSRLRRHEAGVTFLKPMEEFVSDLPERDRLEFERLWQIKAAAADRNHKTVPPILCRAIGAFRHFVADLTVWGAASVSVSLAAEGSLDSLTLQIREPTEEIMDQARIIPPKEAARQIVLQLSTQMGSSENSLEFVRPERLQFGYLSLTKRTSQRLLAPAYIASIAIEGRDEKQASLFAIPATEKTYLPLCRRGRVSGREISLLRAPPQAQ